MGESDKLSNTLLARNMRHYVDLAVKVANLETSEKKELRNEIRTRAFEKLFNKKTEAVRTWARLFWRMIEEKIGESTGADDHDVTQMQQILDLQLREVHKEIDGWEAA